MKNCNDVLKFKKRCYELYQLDWMMTHNYSLQDAFNVLKKGYEEACLFGNIGGGSSPDEDFNTIEEYFEEQGFGGEIFACEEEFYDCEYQDEDYMRYLLSDEEFKQYKEFNNSKEAETPKLKKIFISQPMNNLTVEEINARREKALEGLDRFMLGEKYEIIDSIIKDAPQDAKPLWYFAKSLEMLASADYALFLNGWDTARGCRLENMCAQEYGVQIIYESVFKVKSK